jgi:hypothetical protein
VCYQEQLNKGPSQIKLESAQPFKGAQTSRKLTHSPVSRGAFVFIVRDRLLSGLIVRTDKLQPLPCLGGHDRKQRPG